jgi:hypothetical protein
MGKSLDAVSDELAAFVASCELFFVATAPLAAGGHVNLSPKGLDTFRVLDPKHVAYLDLTGSGNETAAHLLENGRVTFLFCAFSGPPRILRIYGAGRTIRSGEPGWDDLRPRFPEIAGARQIVLVEVERVATSCGFGVPLFDYVGQRDTLPASAAAKGEEKNARYHRERNAHSIDGLPTPFASGPEPRSPDTGKGG